MDSTSKRLERFSSLTPSNWRKEAEERQANKEWLRYSQMIAIKMLDKMEELGLTQKMLAERMGCSQQYVSKEQYVSKVLRGRENLSLETLCKIENALNLQIIHEQEMA